MRPAIARPASPAASHRRVASPSSADGSAPQGACRDDSAERPPPLIAPNKEKNAALVDSDSDKDNLEQDVRSAQIESKTLCVKSAPGDIQYDPNCAGSLSAEATTGVREEAWACTGVPTAQGKEAHCSRLNEAKGGRGSFVAGKKEEYSVSLVKTEKGRGSFVAGKKEGEKHSVSLGKTEGGRDSVVAGKKEGDKHSVSPGKTEGERDAERLKLAVAKLRSKSAANSGAYRTLSGLIDTASVTEHSCAQRDNTAGTTGHSCTQRSDTDSATGHSCAQRDGKISGSGSPCVVMGGGDWLGCGDDSAVFDDIARELEMCEGEVGGGERNVGVKEEEADLREGRKNIGEHVHVGLPSGAKISPGCDRVGPLARLTPITSVGRGLAHGSKISTAKCAMLPEVSSSRGQSSHPTPSRPQIISHVSPTTLLPHVTHCHGNVDTAVHTSRQTNQPSTTLSPHGRELSLGCGGLNPP